MKEKLLTFIYDHQLLKKNKTVLVGVSGGPDSMALLHFFHEIKEEWNITVIALTIDHQLRGEESNQDVQYVKEVCKKWKVPHVSIQVNVKSYRAKKKVSTQVAARTLRYDAFKEQMKIHHGDYLALGHHGDDQIETLVMSLVRTTNLSSLTGIPFKRKFVTGEIIRPLLCVTKHEIEDYCVKHHLQPRIDSTNLDTYYTRNYVRAHIVPKLKKRNHNLHMTVQRLSESLQEDEEYLMEQAKQVVKKTARFDEQQKKASISAKELRSYAVSLQRRAYRLTLDYLYDELPDSLSYMHERIFLSLLSEQMGNQIIHFPKGLHIEKSYDNIFFYFFEKNRIVEKSFHQIMTAIPQSINLPNGAVFSVSYIDVKNAKEKESNPYTYICSKEQIALPIHIRTRRDGDRMRYKGLRGTKKIKDILIDAKVPRHLRDHTYIVADDSDEIFWLIGLRKNMDHCTMSDGTYVLFEYKT
ncbi:tRNA lysidine(34) synthetase TilS [Pseudogracilibacillus auburnensis]|uniref:tRNA(Ile)-lysidine synthase n=1 Tax=Pseudogracilibacillus auburnensis TaxID=1494959 RepID=A0A2V3VK09_9BACI|nr:tRNA lysidine(34) synthetase TilS [Pseudogracilibacillus auburnensis]PXW81564.1 tRNA(Ile)-lysidine synthase [Pseudogracilibacillus auburnensis]